MSNPYWKVLEITFLTLALYHGLNGIYALLQDYIKSPGFRLTMFSAIVLAGLVLLVFGIVTVVSIQSPELVGAAGQTLP